ncbi:MAG: 6-carboxytetrahydropterin synthase [Flammeovirgaceae bacterium]|nr:6-carboxytetrahydropterin synthase [Flammeovirgaceae bacterium]MDW8288126.1 6-carboxytetrahydropterin synthase [Flammeovirgaceae bacterium]
MVYVCRKEYFSAAHKLYNPTWSKEKNCEVFGICANEHWHGHNFELIVTVKGKPSPETGCVIDLKQLGKIIQEKIISKVQDKNLNEEVPFLKNVIPSCENLAIAFWQQIEEPIRQAAPHARLHCIELIETKKNMVKYFGEE